MGKYGSCHTQTRLTWHLILLPSAGGTCCDGQCPSTKSSQLKQGITWSLIHMRPLVTKDYQVAQGWLQVMSSQQCQCPQRPSPQGVLAGEHEFERMRRTARRTSDWWRSRGVLHRTARNAFVRHHAAGSLSGESSPQAWRQASPGKDSWHSGMHPPGSTDKRKKSTFCNQGQLSVLSSFDTVFPS